MTEKNNPPKLSFSFANRHGVILHRMDERTAKLICRAMPSAQLLSELKAFTGRVLKITLLESDAFTKQLTKHYEGSDELTQQMGKDLSQELDLKDLLQELPKAKDLLEMQDDAPIIRLFNALLAQAIKQDASDVHIEAFDEKLMVRFRIDGVLQEVVSLPKGLSTLLVSRVKVMAKLDIAEKRLPQDGRITVKLGGQSIDIRVSTLPSSHGERVVLRLLKQEAAHLDLNSLGMPEDVLEKLNHIIRQSHGIFLVTGPTGSGKTTTLYAALSILNNGMRNILTIEDPVEYDLPGIGQTPVNAKVNMTFARGLRAILRQDPDVVMVGEIRDKETADIAVQASLTGHLVLSTLHTNTAVGAITRLGDMGVQPFLLSSSLLGVAAQRLVRLLCEQCKQARPATQSECEAMGVPEAQIFEAVGCESCRQTGYVGRAGIYEVIVVDETLRQIIHDSQGEQAIQAYVKQHARNIQAHGFSEVVSGKTSLEEVLRVTNSEATT